MKSFPFQSNYLGNDEYGNPRYDRAIGAEFWQNMWKLFFTNGIFANPSTNFQVFAHSGMTVRVRPGACFVQGVTSIENINTDLRLDNSESTRDRIDSIVIRADFSQNRRVTIEVKKDSSSLTRNSDIWELCLAQVRITRNSSSITQSNITDTRFNTSLCGIVSNLVTTVDTTTLFNQYMDYWNRQKQANESEWQAQMSSQNSTFTESQQNRDNQFNTQKNAMQSWFDSVKNDIAKLKGFDLENFFDLKEYRIRSYKSGSYWYTDYSLKNTPTQYKYRVRYLKSGNTYITEISEHSWSGGSVTTVQKITIEQRKSGNEWITEVK